MEAMFAPRRAVRNGIVSRNPVRSHSGTTSGSYKFEKTCMYDEAALSYAWSVVRGGIGKEFCCG